MALPRLYTANGEDKREILRMTLSGFLKTRAPRDRNYLPGARGIALQPLLAATGPISLELFSSNYCCNNEPSNYVDREQSLTYLEIDRRPKSWNWSHALENQEKTYEDTFFFIFLFFFFYLFLTRWILREFHLITIALKQLNNLILKLDVVYFLNYNKRSDCSKIS